MEAIDRFFEVSDRGSSLKTEIRGGLMTFLTMSYVLVLNPQLLGSAGLPPETVVLATAITSGVSTLMIGLLANLPFGLAPGMGMSAYFAYGLILENRLSCQAALTMCMAAGVVCLFLALFKLNETLLSLVPECIKVATVCGMGLLLAGIGLRNAELVQPDADSLLAVGDLSDWQLWLSLFGVVFIAMAQFHQVRGGVVLGIALVSMIYWALTHQWPHRFVSLPDFSKALEGIQFEMLGWSSVPGILAFVFCGAFDVAAVNAGLLRMSQMLTQRSISAALRRAQREAKQGQGQGQAQPSSSGPPLLSETRPLLDRPTSMTAANAAGGGAAGAGGLSGVAAPVAMRERSQTLGALPSFHSFTSPNNAGLSALVVSTASPTALGTGSAAGLGLGGAPAQSPSNNSQGPTQYATTANGVYPAAELNLAAAAAAAGTASAADSLLSRSVVPRGLVDAVDSGDSASHSQWAFLTCGFGTIIGAFLGCGPVIVLVESAAGLSDGCRTGLSSVVTAVCFLLCALLCPLLCCLPAQSTAALLILVGAMMLGEARNIDWDSMTEAIPAFLTVLVLPFTYSVPFAIGLGVGCWLVLFLLSGTFLRLLPGGQRLAMQQQTYGSNPYTVVPEPSRSPWEDDSPSTARSLAGPAGSLSARLYSHRLSYSGPYPAGTTGLLPQLGPAPGTGHHSSSRSHPHTPASAYRGLQVQAGAAAAAGTVTPQHQSPRSAGGHLHQQQPQPQPHVDVTGVVLQSGGPRSPMRLLSGIKDRQVPGFAPATYGSTDSDP